MSHSQRYDFVEMPILTKDGLIVGYVEGYALLAVATEDGETSLDDVDCITLHTEVADRTISHGEATLAFNDPLFSMIANEIHRRADSREIELEPDDFGVDPDYAYDMRASA